MAGDVASLSSDNALLREDYGGAGRSSKKKKKKGKARKKKKSTAIPAEVDRHPSRILRAMRP